MHAEESESSLDVMAHAFNPCTPEEVDKFSEVEVSLVSRLAMATQ